MTNSIIVDPDRLELFIASVQKKLEKGLELEQALEVSAEKLRLEQDESAVYKDAYRNEIEEEDKVVRGGYPPPLTAVNRKPWYPGPDVWPNGTWNLLQIHLRAYLARKKLTEDAIDARINKLRSEAVQVTGLLSNPHEVRFKTRGLVLGQVQSGKTANMSAVAAMATDAGYTAVVVFSGLTNKLRKQTQERLSEELVSPAETVQNARFHWRAPTTASQDFQETMLYASTDFNDPDIKHLIVVKKNITPLEELLNALKKIPPQNKPRFLFIDDECDQAGVNAKSNQSVNAIPNQSYDPDNPKETNRTKINELLTEIINTPERSSYIGYTATPYANVFANPDDCQDIYPKDFICPIQPAPGYFGTEKLFGRITEEPEEPDIAGINVFRPVKVKEASKFLVARTDKDVWTLPELPQMLDEAINWHLLATAVRRLRGATESDAHSTMLVHTVRYVSPQSELASLIEKSLKCKKAKIEKDDSEYKDELLLLWQRELGKVPPESGSIVPEFDAIWKELPAFIADVDCVQEHGGNTDDSKKLDFKNRRHYSVVVGSDILSRGLTIEGLVTSYFLRETKQYDTLSQMGRWFGYRPGYEDLVRIYTTEKIKDWYKNLSRVEHELRDEIALMAVNGFTPREHGIPIRLHSQQSPTGAAKMQWTGPARPKLEGRSWQMLEFPTGDDEQGRKLLERSLNATIAFVKELAEQNRITPLDGGSWIARDLSGRDIVSFFKQYGTVENNNAFQDAYKFINGDLATRLEDDPNHPYSRWNVVIKGLKKKQSSRELAFTDSVSIKLPERTRHKGESPGKYSNSDASELIDGASWINIKGLLEKVDLVSDFEPRPTSSELDGMDQKQVSAMRGASHSDGRTSNALLIIYVIDRNSKPKKNKNQEVSKTRLALDTASDPVGLGVVFPCSGRFNAAYVSVNP